MIPLILIGGGAALAGWGLYKIFSSDDDSTSTPATIEIVKKLAILGPQGSGKTKLWCALQGKPRTMRNTGVDLIKSFLLSQTDRVKVFIEETKDIGGGDGYVEKYGKLVSEETFVYFLLDITKIGREEYNMRPLAQLKTLLSLFPGSGEKSVHILATHIDEYRGDRLLGEKVVRDYLAPLEGYGYDRTKFGVTCVDLTNSNYIEKIKEEILRSLL